MTQIDTSEKDVLLATAIASGATASAAAKQLDLSLSTVQRRMSEPSFRRLVSDLRGEMIASALGRMAEKLTAAADSVARPRTPRRCGRHLWRIDRARHHLRARCQRHYWNVHARRRFDLRLLAPRQIDRPRWPGRRALPRRRELRTSARRPARAEPPPLASAGRRTPHLVSRTSYLDLLSAEVREGFADIFFGELRSGCGGQPQRGELVAVQEPVEVVAIHFKFCEASRRLERILACEEIAA